MIHELNTVKGQFTKIRNYYQIVFDMLDIMNRYPLGISPNKTLELARLSFNYKKAYFEDILIKYDLVEIKKKKTNDMMCDIYAVTGKGLRYMILFKELNLIFSTDEDEEKMQNV